MSDDPNQRGARSRIGLELEHELRCCRQAFGLDARRLRMVALGASVEAVEHQLRGG
ncbi:hypothetical protein K4L06_17690 [Lysobacter sp. BMK333-48F3]|uniref:hypothetical protein n=1 Tax=Lysobacter sp. BMK333-48F3 TaxID=2867962 RepID=UPI001C8BDA2D|nr:hypothetical protein [Lysobacter sp. BMK333-48F3]MBX9403145.1 hypothetical protein [Lysobacter sp. BMK333-48F3]